MRIWKMRLRSGAMLGIVAAIGGTSAATPAQAEWQRATSRHFVIYADDDPADLRRMTTQLEQFDTAIRVIYPAPDRASDANPVTIFVVPSVDDIQRICGGCANVAGFYVPRVTGSIAFTPARGMSRGNDALKPQTVLFHEYAHHFLLGSADATFPQWFSEGFAEFVATATFPEGHVQLGNAALHRAAGLAENSVTTKMLFSPAGRRLTGAQYEEVYGRGWLLTHYIMFDHERRKKLAQYIRLLNSGTPSLEAATQAFGDLKLLDREIDAYVRRNTIPGMRVPLSKVPAIGPIDIRPLTAGERALIDERMTSVRGVDTKAANRLFPAARKVAAAYPADAVAQGWLAEMAYDAGQDDEAEAAANRALAADPKSIQALLYKARVHLRRAEAAKSADAGVWREARSWIVRANRLENDNAAALQLYFQSFAMEGVPVSKPAIAGLKRAFELVPQDKGLRFSVVAQDIADGDIDSAKRTLRPLAYDPHAGPDSRAAKLMAALDTGKTKEAAMAALAEASKASD